MRLPRESLAERRIREDAQRAFDACVRTAAMFRAAGRAWPSSLLDRMRHLLAQGARFQRCELPSGLEVAIARGAPPPK